MRMRIIGFLLFASILPGAQAYDSPEIAGFIDEMVAKHSFRRDELEQLFQQAEYKQSIIDAITSPATLKPWVEYRDNFINKQRIARGLKFWRENESTLRRAQQKYGVPPEIIVALLGVETYYGKLTGSYRVVDALATLSFDYPARAPFFRSELEEFLLLARNRQYDILSLKGSYAGAMGMPQFMPSNYRRLAVDFSGDGKVDLWKSRADIIGSVANYLRFHGWVRGEPVALRAKINTTSCPGDITAARTLTAWGSIGIVPEQAYPISTPARLLSFTVQDGMEYWLVFNNFDMLMAYNTSSYYAMTIFQLSEELRKARSGELRKARKGKR